MILKRSERKLYPKLWDLPGGYKENDETYEQCVIREFKEETDLKVKIKKLELVKSHIYNNDIIVVLIYSVISNDIDNIKLDNAHIQFKFSDRINNDDSIWYLKGLDFVKIKEL